MSNLTTCPTCSKSVSESAETCPHCGHRLKTPFSVGRVLLLLILVLLVFGAFKALSE